MTGESSLTNTAGVVSIKQTSQADLDSLRQLWNDGRVMRWVGYPAGLNYDSNKMEEWYQWISIESSCRHFMVLQDGATCGEVFYRVDALHRRAGLDIKLFPEFQGKGIACQALNRLIEHCFEHAKVVEEVWTEPSNQNTSAQKLYRKCALFPKIRPADLVEAADSYWALERTRWEKSTRNKSIRDKE